MTWTSLGRWYEWAKMGGNWATYALTPVSWGRGRIDVFVVGSTDGKMYHTWLEPGGTIWQPQGTFENLGGVLAGRPVAVSSGRCEVGCFCSGGGCGIMAYGILVLELEELGESGWGCDTEAVSPTADSIDVFVWWSEDGGYERGRLIMGTGVRLRYWEGDRSRARRKRGWMMRYKGLWV